MSAHLPVYDPLKEKVKLRLDNGSLIVVSLRAWRNFLLGLARRAAVFVLLLFVPFALFAQQATTVSDAIVGAMGKITVTVAMTFTTFDGYTIAAGTQYQAVFVNGQFTISLAPTVGAAPYNAFYYADYATLTTRVREQWTLPSSTAPLKLSAVRVLWPKPPNVLVPAAQVVPPPTCTPLGASGTNLVLRYTTNPVGWVCAPDNVGALTFNLENPTAADAGKFQWKVKNGLTLTRVACNTDQGTVSVNLETRSEDAPNASGTAMLSAPVACGPTGASATNFSSATVAGSTSVALVVTGTSGAPTIVRISAEYQLN